jgi:hypothetical protein
MRDGRAVRQVVTGVCSEGDSFVTGRDDPVDGGMVAG